jgi:hypothetical protein
VNDDGGILGINTIHLNWETSLVSFPLQENHAKVFASEELVVAMNAMGH